MSEVVRWEAPPPNGRLGQVRSKYAEMATALRARPNEWALVLEDGPRGTCNSLAARMRSGASVFEPRGAFEARTVGAARAAKVSLYARYIGGTS